MSEYSVEAGPVAQLDVLYGLAVDREVVGHAVIVHAHGEIDMSNAELLDHQLHAASAVALPPAPVVLDLTDVSFLPSTGLALLVAHHDRCAGLGSPLRVVATDRRVLRPIEITGVDQMCVLVATVGEALLW